MNWWTDKTPPTVYCWDDANIYTHSCPAFPSPEQPGVWLVPARGTLIAPPDIPAGFRAVWQGAWVLEEIPEPDPTAEPTAIQAAMTTMLLASMGLAVDDTAQADAGVTLLKAAGVAPASDAEAPWKAGEYVEIGAVRTVDTTRYTCICAHLTGEHWHPTKAVGHVWEVTVSEEGTLEQPIPFVLGMAVKLGLHYSYGGKVYKWIVGDMASCGWPPGSAGVWQWEVTG